MKAKNLNNSSRKTRLLIKKVFAEMMSEKKELNKISVSELVKRAKINRGTFYSHYDDIYCVAEDYESELIDGFFNNSILNENKSIEEFIDLLFDFIKKNNENYQLLSKSNDFIFAAKKLSDVASTKLLEILKNDPRLKTRDFLDIEVSTFVDGILCEYVKFCRGYSNNDINYLYDYTKYWLKTL